MGTDETVNCPSLGAGGATGAAGALRAHLPGRAEAVCVLGADVCSLVAAAWWLNGAGAFAGELATGCVAALSVGTSVGWRLKIIANPTIKHNPPTTPPT
ncbi:MAG: hypothetical protein WA738_16000, partial [Candidatus Angelobacter sp.]